MNAKPVIILLAGIILLFTGCAYVNVKTPFDTDLNRTELGSKKGTADAYCIFWLVAWGEMPVMRRQPGKATSRS